MDKSNDSETNPTGDNQKKPRIPYGTKTRHSKRQQKTIKNEERFITNTNWTLAERKLLLDAFITQHCKPDDLDTLSILVPTRSKKQIEIEIAKLKAFSSKMDVTKKVAVQTNITSVDSWLNLLHDIVYYEDADHSNGIAQLMGIAGKYEHLNQISSRKRPNYPRLYQYIADVLRGQDPPALTPVENAVMLELMKGLKDKLQLSDVADKQKVLRWKYSNLTTKFNLSQVSQIILMQNKTFLNEFPEELGLIPDERKKDAVELASSHYPNPSSSKHQPTPSSDLREKPFTSENLIPDTTSPSPLNCANKSRPEVISDSSSITKPSADVSTSNSGETTQTERLSGSKEDEFAVKFTKPSADVSVTSNSGETTPLKRKLSTSDDDGHVKWRMRESLDKPKLLTLNPFCIPVGMLKFKSKHTG